MKRGQGKPRPGQSASQSALNDLPLSLHLFAILLEMNVLIDMINPALGNQMMMPVGELDRAALRAVHDADFLATGHWEEVDVIQVREEMLEVQIEELPLEATDLPADQPQPLAEATPEPVPEPAQPTLKISQMEAMKQALVDLGLGA